MHGGGRRTRVRRITSLLAAATIAAACTSTSRGGTDTAAPTTSAPPAATTTTAVPIPAPLGEAAVPIAEAELASRSFGSVAVVPGEPEVVTGSTLTTVRLPLVVDGRPVAIDPLQVTVAADGSTTSIAGADTIGWDEVVPLPEGGESGDTAALVAATLGLESVVVEETTTAWVPVGHELRDGVVMVVSDPAGAQRFRVVLDAVTQSVVDIEPLVTETSADDCPEPALPAPAACVGGPQPEIPATDRALTGLDDRSGAGGLDGNRARVVALPGRTDPNDFDATTGDPAAFADGNARWGGNSDDLWFAAATAYFWITDVNDRLAGMGFDDLVADPVQVAIADRPLGGVAYVRGSDNQVFFGTTSSVHSAGDAAIVVHELGHWLVTRSSPRLGSSGWMEARAFKEANSDIVAFLTTVTFDLTDPACFAPVIAPAGDACGRRLDDDVRYPTDSLNTDYYTGGRVWTSALFHAFTELVAAAGGSIDQCLPASACATVAERLLHTLAEAWPLMDDSRLTLPEAAAAVLAANEALGLLDPAVLRAAFDERGLLEPTVTSASLTVQHPAPVDLRVTIDVVDATGTVRCNVATDVPGAAHLAFDASVCSDHLPASPSQVWRATIVAPADTSPGRVLEFAVRAPDGNGAAVRPTAGEITGAAGQATVVTIPDGADTDLGAAWSLDGVQVLSGVGLDEDAGRVVAVTTLNGVQLTGFDLATGEALWAQPYSYGTSYTGIPAGFVMLDSTIVSLSWERRDGSTVVGVAAFDVGDGTRRWFTPVEQAFSVAQCGATVCVTAGDDGERIRVDTASGAILGPFAGSGIDELPVAGIGGDNVSMSEGSTPTLRRWDPETGSTVWTSTPAADLAADTSGGWHTMYRDDLGLYLMSIGPTSDLLGGTAGFTAAIEPETGRVRWTLDNAWIPDGFPDDGPVYVITYEPGFGFGGSATGSAVLRLDPATGRSLATAVPEVDPLALTYAFGIDSTTMWWRDGDGAVLAGHDMRLDVPLVLPATGVAWELVPRDAVTVGGEERSVPPGHRAVDLGTDRAILTRQLPSWIGAAGDRWIVFVTATGGLAATPR